MHPCVPHSRPSSDSRGACVVLFGRRSRPKSTGAPTRSQLRRTARTAQASSSRRCSGAHSPPCHPSGLQAARADDEISSKTHHLSGMSAAVIMTIIRCPAAFLTTKHCSLRASHPSRSFGAPRFERGPFAPELLAAVKSAGFTAPSPIQAQVEGPTLVRTKTCRPTPVSPADPRPHQCSTSASSQRVG